MKLASSARMPDAPMMRTKLIFPWLFPPYRALARYSMVGYETRGKEEAPNFPPLPQPVSRNTLMGERFSTGEAFAHPKITCDPSSIFVLTASSGEARGVETQSGPKHIPRCHPRKRRPPEPDTFRDLGQKIHAGANRIAAAFFVECLGTTTVRKLRSRQFFCWSISSNYPPLEELGGLDLLSVRTAASRTDTWFADDYAIRSLGLLTPLRGSSCGTVP
jgi:hypothetical protein